ncbi:MAG: protein-glutamate O-methyltransferase CheR [Sandaracinaceae bacterium]
MSSEHNFIRNHVMEASAIVLDATKAYLIDTRLRAVLREHDIPDLTSLVRELRRKPRGALSQAVVEALTTNETSFFRDLTYYDALRETVIPSLIERRGSARELNVWSAACSTGQEPYSLAMMLADLPALEDWKLRVHTTDIDRNVLERAKSGEYTQLEVNRGLPAANLLKHFEKTGKNWRVQGRAREMVTFAHLNLAKPWPHMPRMDLVLIRNVLIYFNMETKRDILRRARRVMRPGGYLVLGGAETTINLTEAYERVRHGRAVMYKAAA